MNWDKVKKAIGIKPKVKEKPPTSEETRRAYFCEVTQNGTLAIVVASTFFDSTIYLIPAAIYSLIMYFTIIPLIFYLRRN